MVLLLLDNIYYLVFIFAANMKFRQKCMNTDTVKSFVRHKSSRVL